MNQDEFLNARYKLKKTQKQMAELLGTSIKAVSSYEQGWRKIPSYIERQIFFLLSQKQGLRKTAEPCWVIKKCPPERKKQCPAWEFHAGKLCWFINGTICECSPKENWQKKMEICRTCEVLKKTVR